MPRRIRRPADKEDIFEALTKGESEVFASYKDVMMMAACIGYSKNKRKPFDKTLEPIAWSVFKDTDASVINALALAACDDITILLDDDSNFDRKLIIFEEYANAGLESLKAEVLNAPGIALENVINQVFGATPSADDGDGGAILSSLAKQLLPSD